MDSLSVPNHLGADRYDPVLPPVNAEYEQGWAARIDAWLQTQAVGAYAIVPYAGRWVTTRDPTTYVAADGVVFEGFAMWGEGDPLAVDDWRLQDESHTGVDPPGQACNRPGVRR